MVPHKLTLLTQIPMLHCFADENKNQLHDFKMLQNNTH